MAGFRTSSKLSKFASNLVYTSPGSGTSSSVSISVIAPKKAKVFVQQAALGGVALSSAQSFAPQTGSFSLTTQINPTWLNKNAIIRWTTHDGYGTTSRDTETRLGESLSSGVYRRPQVVYAWGETNADGTFTETNLKSSGPTPSASGANWTGYYYNYNGTRYGSSDGGGARNVGMGNTYICGFWKPPMLDYRNDPARMLVQPAMLYNGTGAGVVRSTGTNNTPLLENQGMYGTRTEFQSQLSIQNNNALAAYDNSMFRYTNDTNTGSYQGVLFDAFDQCVFTGNTNAYISFINGWSPFTGSLNQALSTNIATGNNNPFYQTMQQSGMASNWYSVIGTKHNCGWTWSGTGVGANAVAYWHFFAPRDSSGTNWRISRWPAGTASGYEGAVAGYPSFPAVASYFGQNDITAPTNSGVKLRPVWYREINGYHYIGFQQSARDGTTGETALVKSSTTNLLTCTWSTVSVPSYVDCYYPPIIANATQAFFAQNTDTNRWAGFTQNGSGTDPWVQNALDYSAITKPYVAPAPAVTTALTAASLTGTGTRDVPTTQSLYGKAVHTSDSSFRNILSTYGNAPVASTIRADDSDLTGELSTDFERTNLVLSPNDKVFIYTEDENTIAQIYGYEE